MKIELLDQNKIAKLNNFKEVTNPVNFDKGMVPTPNGLFGSDIFGHTIYDQRHRPAYIDLKRKYINPKAYITLKSINNKFEYIVYGTKKFRIEDGQLIEDENGETGVQFLYDNWKKIKLEKNYSKKRNTRIDMITSSDKDSIFISKWFVIPVFYRNVNLQQADSGRPRIPEVNDLYNSLIRNTKLIEENNNFDFMVNSIVGRNQDILVEIYNLYKSKVEGKHGHLRRNVLAKSVDYCSRITITAVPYDSKSYDEQYIDFEHTGVPLSFCCSQLTPFILWWVRRWFDTRIISQKNQFPIMSPATGKKEIIKLQKPEEVFNDDYIRKALSRFINNPSSRFDKIELPISDDDKELHKLPNHVYVRLVGYTNQLTTMNRERVTINNLNTEVNRPITWTDLFYMAANDVSADKHVMITRYPMLDYLGMFLSRIHVMSTRQTIPMVINDHLYKTYPVIDLDMDYTHIESQFIDSCKISPLYLDSMGGDHDGDQITSKILFSKEANEEAERIMHRKSNVMSIEGTFIRKTGNEGIQALYTMTRFH